MQGLLYIEYGFHITLMVAGLILAYSFLTMLRASEASVAPLARAKRAVVRDAKPWSISGGWRRLKSFATLADNGGRRTSTRAEIVG